MLELKEAPEGSPRLSHLFSLSCYQQVFTETFNCTEPLEWPLPEDRNATWLTRGDCTNDTETTTTWYYWYTTASPDNCTNVSK